MGTTTTTAKVVPIIFRCKKCKFIRREDVAVETRVYDNEHPVHYLRKVERSKREAGGRWVQSHYFQVCRPCNCPAVYPGHSPQAVGKAVEGRLKADHPCDARCTGALGHSCECSCGGENHGIDHK
jgi:hypothetical protein